MRSYAQTLDRLRRDLGPDTPLSALTSVDVARLFDRSWGAASARTWNRHRAATRSFVAWLADHRHVRFDDELTTGLPRRAEPRSEVAPTVDVVHLDALRSRPDLALRERTLWWLLEESAAPVSSVLALNVQDLDLEYRRGWLPAKSAWVTWRSRTAALLPELVAGRARGPVFITDRRPGPGRAEPDDRCPDTGRARLSYERAEYLFKRATRSIDPAGEGHTLGRLTTLARVGR